MRTFIVLLLTGAAIAQDAPGPVHFLGRRIAKTMSYHGASWLVRQEREREERTSELLKALEIKPGQVICDLGCGNGYHVLPMAEMVGEKGRVLAVDIQPQMLTLLKRRAKKAGILERVEPILCTATDPKLPPSSVDVVLMVDVYHEISHPAEVMRHVRASLKPKGRVVFVEFRTEDLSVPIKHEHKMSRKQVVREAAAHGLKLVKSFDELPWQHVLFFERGPVVAPKPTPRPLDGVEGMKISSSAELVFDRVDGAIDCVIAGVAPKARTGEPVILEATIEGARLAGPLRFRARARGVRGDTPGWVSMPIVSEGKRIAHAGSDRWAAVRDTRRSIATWEWPFMRVEKEGPSVVLMLERTTADEEIQVVQEKGRLTVVGIQRRWEPGQPVAFRFGVVPAEKGSDAHATERYEAWSHEHVR